MIAALRFIGTVLAVILTPGIFASARGQSTTSILDTWTETRAVYREIFLELATYRAKRIMYYQPPNKAQGTEIDAEELARIRKLADQIAREAYRTGTE